MVVPRASSAQIADVELTLKPGDHLPLFSNLITVQMDNEAFIITLAFIQPDGGKPIKGSVLGRFVVSPAHAKRIVQTLAEQVERHEAHFGPISSDADLQHLLERSH